MNNPVYIGIDQSVGGFGLSILCPDAGWHDTTVKAFPLDKHDGRGVVQLLAVEEWLRESLRNVYQSVGHVVMEGYSHGSKFGREKAGELGYAVKRLLYKGIQSDVCHPTVVPPTQVKQFATGYSGASKQEIIDAVNELWNVGIHNDNAADAYVMARIAYALDTGSVATPYQAEVLKRIKNPTPKKKRVRQKVSA